MRRAHRTVHRALWPVLAVLVMIGLAAALWLRPKPVISDQESVIRKVASEPRHWEPVIWEQTSVIRRLPSDYWSLITDHWS
jgi:hypothetical protein